MKKLVAMIAVLAIVLAMPVCAFAVKYEGDDDETKPAPTDTELVPTEINTSFIEPNYYPDYDVAEEAEETAPKTGDFSMLPQFMMAAAAAGSLAVACKRAK